MKGERITIENGQLKVPDHPIIPFIEGDGTGADIWKASRRVFDAAVEKVYHGHRQVIWYEVFAGEISFNRTGQWLPPETTAAFREYLVGIKGPLTTPIGGVQKFSRLREGVERFFVTDINNPAGSAIAHDVPAGGERGLILEKERHV